MPAAKRPVVEPTTPPEKLSQLASKSTDLAVLRAVADHPATTDPVFAKLIRRAPASVLASARLASLGPEAFGSWAADDVAALLCHRDAPPHLVGWARAQSRPLWALALWVASPEARSLARTWAPDLLGQLAAVASRFVEPLPADAVDLLGDEFHRRYAHATPARLAWVDLTGRKPDELRQLADHPAADARVLGAIAERLEARRDAGGAGGAGDGASEDEVSAARARALAAPLRSTDEQIAPPQSLAPALAALAEGDEAAARDALERMTEEVAFRRLLVAPHLGPAERTSVRLRALAWGVGWQRGVALRNLLSSSELGPRDLDDVAAVVHDAELGALLGDARLSAAALSTLWGRFPGRQNHIVVHPGFPPALLGDRDDLVASLALQSSTDEAWLESRTRSPLSLSHLASLCRNPRCPPAVLALAASHPVAHTRGLAAAHPRADGPTLALLAADADRAVRELVALNEAAPPEALAALAGDPVPQVRRAVAANRATPHEARLALAGDQQAGVRRQAEKALERARSGA